MTINPRSQKSEKGRRHHGHKAVSDATQGKAKVDNHANICQCCGICFAPYGYPQGEVS